MSTISRKERERMARRDEILEAAAAVFAEHGYNGATIQEVAQRAELSVGTLYNFFENKQELFNKLIVREARRLHEGLREAMAEAASPREKIVAYIRACMQELGKRLDLARLYVETVRATRFGLPAGLDEEGASIDREFDAELEAVVTEGIRRGELADMPPQAVVALLGGMMNAVALKVIQDGDTSNLDRYAEACLRMVNEGLWGE
jgi:AcrR family transcriptional regulator